MIVRENISFERGKDPKDSMGIGLSQRIALGIKSLSQDPLVRQYIHIYRISESEKGSRYNSFPDDANLYIEISAQEIPTKELMQGLIEEHIGLEYFSGIVEDNQMWHVWRPMIKREYEKNFIEASKIIDGVESIPESISFERRKDPKDSMRIGLTKKWMDLMKFKSLFRITKTFHTNHRNQIEEDADYYKFDEGDYLEIYGIPTLHNDGTLSFTAYLIVDKARKTRLDDYFIWGFPIQLEEHLQKVNKIGESVNFERGQNPKKSMNIGSVKVMIQAIEDFIRSENSYSDDVNEVFISQNDPDTLMISYEDTRYIPNINGSEDEIHDLNIKDMKDHAKSAGLDTYVDFDDWNFSEATGVFHYGFPIRPQFVGLINNKSFYIRGNNGKFIEEPYDESLSENVNFERGRDPKHSMEVGLYDTLPRIVEGDYYSAGDHVIMSSDQIKKLFKDPFDPSLWEKDFAFHVIWPDGKEDYMFLEDIIKNPNIDYIAYDDEIFDVAIKIYESINFERGRNPKDSMNIGLKARRIFDEMQEFVMWMFKFPDVFSDGMIKEWDFKIRNTENRFIVYPQIRNRKLRYIKWVRDNIKHSDGEKWGLKESKDAIDYLERFLIERSEKRVNEILEFERGQDPKKTMEIGLAKMVNDYKWDNEFWKLGNGNRFYKLIDFDRIIFWRGIPILVVKAYDKTRFIEGYMAMTNISAEHKIGFGSTFITEKGPETAIRNLKRKILKNHRVRKLLTESINFERGKSPKDSMDIGKRKDSVEILSFRPSLSPNDVIYFLENPRLTTKMSLMIQHNNSKDKYRSVVTWDELKRDYPDVIFQDKYYNLRRKKEYFTLKESINFERGKDPKDSMSIGAKYADDVARINRITTESGKTIDNAYDIRKFFQNIEAGLYPSNFYVIVDLDDDNQVMISAPDLQDGGWGNPVPWTKALYNGKLYDLG